MNRLSAVIAVVAVAGMACAASASTVYINTTGNGETGTGSRQAWASALSGQSVLGWSNLTRGTVHAASGGTSTGSFNIGAAVATIALQDSVAANRGFYLNNAGGLRGPGPHFNLAPSTYFDGGDGDTYHANSGRAQSSTNVLAFGNTTYLSNRLRINFAPGLRALGFSFEDIGDVSNSTMIIRWRDVNGVIASREVGRTRRTEDGFAGIIVDANETLMSLDLVQTNPCNNDGFTLYDFQAVLSPVVLVPAPHAAAVGFAGLVGIGAFARRRRTAM